MKMADSHMSRGHGLEVDDVSGAVGFEGPCRATEFTQKHSTDVVCINDTGSAFDQLSAFEHVEPHTVGLRDFIDL